MKCKEFILLLIFSSVFSYSEEVKTKSSIGICVSGSYCYSEDAVDIPSMLMYLNLGKKMNRGGVTVVLLPATSCLLGEYKRLFVNTDRCELGGGASLGIIQKHLFDGIYSDKDDFKFAAGPYLDVGIGGKMIKAHLIVKHLFALKNVLLIATGIGFHF